MRLRLAGDSKRCCCIRPDNWCHKRLPCLKSPISDGPGLELPIDHFRLLGVNPTTDLQTLLRTLQQRIDRAPDQGFTQETLLAREELLRASAELLSDSSRRQAYESDLTALAGSGPALMPALDVPRDEDISCPNMFRLGDKWMLLCLSHWIGSRYYLGRFQDERFLPEAHGRMNWMCAFNQGHEDADVFAPESLLTPDGRRVMWAWSRMKQRLKDVPIQSSIQCLPRELSLPADGVLRIKPLRELERLRYRARSERNITIPANGFHRLKRINGDTLELRIVFHSGSARRFGVQVYCDPEGRNGFPITFEPAARTLTLGETKIPFELRPAENLELRVFLDKSIIEVFANDRLAALSPHRYAAQDLGVSLFSEGGSVRAKDIRSWRLQSIYTGTTAFAPANPSGHR